MGAAKSITVKNLTEKASPMCMILQELDPVSSWDPTQCVRLLPCKIMRSKSQICHIVAVWLWAKLLTSTNLKIFNHKVGF